MTALEDVRRDYRAAFLRYLPRREEAALHVGYELGRAVVIDGLSILDLAQLYHDVFLEVLTDSQSDDLTGGPPPRRSSSSRCSPPTTWRNAAFCGRRETGAGGGRLPRTPLRAAHDAGMPTISLTVGTQP